MQIHNSFWNAILSWIFLLSIDLFIFIFIDKFFQEFKLEKLLGLRNMQKKLGNIINIVIIKKRQLLRNFLALVKNKIFKITETNLSKYFSLLEQTLAEVMQRQSNAALNRLQDQLSDLISLLCRTKDLLKKWREHFIQSLFLKIQLRGTLGGFFGPCKILGLSGPPLWCSS